MPANIVKPGQEGKWKRAKRIAKKQYPDLPEDRFYAVVTTIFKNMIGENVEYLTEKDIEKYATSEEKEFLLEIEGE